MEAPTAAEHRSCYQTNGHIYYEERRSQVYVTVVDSFGDGHMFYLEHDGMSKAQALDLLKAKQQELNNAK